MDSERKQSWTYPRRHRVCKMKTNQSHEIKQKDLKDEESYLILVGRRQQDELYAWAGT